MKKDALLSNLIEIEKIEEGENIRKDYDDKSLAELAESIKKYGVIQPLIVRKFQGNGEKYLLIAGHRRLRAAKIVAMPKVPVALVVGNKKDDFYIQVIENTHRKNLSSLELAKVYKKYLNSNPKITQQDVAKAFCKSQAHVSQILKLNDISKYQKEKIKKGESYAKMLSKHSPNYTGEETQDTVPISRLSVSNENGITADKETDIEAKTELVNSETPEPFRENQNELLLSFKISGSSPERIAEELKAKLEGRGDISGSIVSIGIKLSELRDEEIEKMLTVTGDYGYIDDSGNFVEI